MSKRVSIRYLIDMAIGNPEPGVVNFNALYTVIQAICEKLDLEDEEIDIDSSYFQVEGGNFESKSNVSSEQFMSQQVYDIPQESRTAQMEDPSKEIKGFQSVPYQVGDDRKVVFDKKENEDMLNQHESKKSKNLRTKQQIDFINSRLAKIEEIAVWNLDTEQNVECLRQIVQQFQDKVETLEQIVTSQQGRRASTEEDISTCAIKQNYERIAQDSEELRQELKDLKALTIRMGGAENMKELRNSLGGNSLEMELNRLDDQLVELKTKSCHFEDKMTHYDEDVERFNNFLKENKIEIIQNDISSIKLELVQHTHILQERQFLVEKFKKLEPMIFSKMDKADAEERLSEKADHAMLNLKVSSDFLNAELRRIGEQLSEITKYINSNEEFFQSQIDNIKRLIGDEALSEVLKHFKSKIDKDIQRVATDLKNFTEIKPEVDTAATRIKDMTCLCCDQDVVMRSVEINSLAKFNDAYVSKCVGPSIALEVGKLRAEGRIGLFNDDDTIFELRKKMRHSGGAHTVITKKDQVEKIRPPKTIKISTLKEMKQ